MIALHETDSPARDRKEFAKKLARINSVLEFRSLLEQQAIQDEWARSGFLTFKAGSPSSAMVIYEQLKRGKNLNLKQVFYSELNLSVRFSLRNDFPEGIRALLIDKDLKPNWQPATLEEVSKTDIETYFTPIWDTSEHPLHFLDSEI